MKSFQLLQTVSDSGKRYFIDGKRVSREAFLSIKTGPHVRLDCFMTRATRKIVRNYCTATHTI